MYYSMFWKQIICISTFNAVPNVYWETHERVFPTQTQLFCNEYNLLCKQDAIYRILVPTAVYAVLWCICNSFTHPKLASSRDFQYLSRKRNTLGFRMSISPSKITDYLQILVQTHTITSNFHIIKAANTHIAGLSWTIILHLSSCHWPL